MMKHHGQQSMNGSGSEANGGGSPSSVGGGAGGTQWWYKGPDGETYGPYVPREMLAWSKTGYFADALPVKTDKDDGFHPIGDWTTVMGGANPFNNNNVPPFHVLAHALTSGQQPPHAQPFMLYPPGLPQPSAAGYGSVAAAAAAAAAGRFGAGFAPNGASPAAQMAALHLGSGAAGAPHLAMHHHMQHHGGPLSQPPSEPNDGANSSASHTPDSGEQDFRALHHMGMPPPPVPAAMQARMNQYYGGAAAMQSMQQQLHQHQQQLLQQQQQQHGAPLSAAAAAAAAGAAVHNSNGQLQYSRLTSTHDAPWNIKKEVGVDASQRPPQRNTIQTQTLPVIIGSKDASRLLSDLTGCQIVIT